LGIVVLTLLSLAEGVLSKSRTTQVDGGGEKTQTQKSSKWMVKKVGTAIRSTVFKR